MSLSIGKPYHVFALHTIFSDSQFTLSFIMADATTTDSIINFLSISLAILLVKGSEEGVCHFHSRQSHVVGRYKYLPRHLVYDRSRDSMESQWPMEGYHVRPWFRSLSLRETLVYIVQVRRDLLNLRGLVEAVLSRGGAARCRNSNNLRFRSLIGVMLNG
jgi:hypothetical protein